MRRALPLLLLLAACANSPSPKVWGGQSETVTVGGRSYTVTWTEDRFEVVRHGWASSGEHQEIRATMIALASEVTGCRVYETSITGDSGEIHGLISC